MQVIKTVALQAANNTGQRIREQAAWFYLRHMNIDEDTSPLYSISCAPDKAKRKKRYGASFVLVQPCSKHSFMIR